MLDSMNIGASPVEEDCAQVGSNDYYERSRKECRAFAGQLLRQFGEPPPLARLTVKRFPHNFGEYREVCVVFDDEDKEGLEYALKLERNTPMKWDAEARKELGL